MIGIILQARMGSTRLPGKVLKDIAGRPMISYQLERLQRARHVETLVVATTDRAKDDSIAEFCSAAEVACFRGSEDDVLSRYCDAAIEFKVDPVVRITADCPLIDPALIDSAIEMFSGPKHPDYVSNMLEPTWPYGMAVEVVSTSVLIEANAQSRSAWDREHVTPFVYRHADRYRLASMTRRPDLSHHRWTVDTAEDFELIARILGALYSRKPTFDLGDVCALLNEHADWVQLNAHIKQRQPVA